MKTTKKGDPSKRKRYVGKCGKCGQSCEAEDGEVASETHGYYAPFGDGYSFTRLSVICSNCQEEIEVSLEFVEEPSSAFCECGRPLGENGSCPRC